MLGYTSESDNNTPVMAIAGTGRAMQVIVMDSATVRLRSYRPEGGVIQAQ